LLIVVFFAEIEKNKNRLEKKKIQSQEVRVIYQKLPLSLHSH